MTYVEKIKADPSAKTVKLADLQHSMNLIRLAVVTPQDQERAYRYLAATRLLEHANDCVSE